ncbi:MAG: hypothetical protein KatS3mg102_1555 [Planctomycetota bacterium]|nr:MAG: hypothetical protein KatS3mg102_1555 [Planctomycetota bacterium]
MDQPDADSRVLKKVYFIKKAREGEELVTLLKNKFKTIDAIRDVIGWYREGREFSVDLSGPAPEQAEAGPQPTAAGGSRRLRFRVSKWVPQAENNRAVLGAIGHILHWLDTEQPFDIALIPHAHLEASPGSYSLN